MCIRIIWPVWGLQKSFANDLDLGFPFLHGEPIPGENGIGGPEEESYDKRPPFVPNNCTAGVGVKTDWREGEHKRINGMFGLVPKTAPPIIGSPTRDWPLISSTPTHWRACMPAPATAELQFIFPPMIWWAAGTIIDRLSVSVPTFSRAALG